MGEPSFADLQPYDVKALQSGFHAFSPRVAYIKLCERSHCRPITEVARMFPSEVGVWDEVTSIDLSRTYVGPKGLQVIVELCKLFPQVTYFSAMDSHLTNESVYHIVAMALFHPSLSKINVSCNRFISFTGAMWLLELTQRNSRITHIQLLKTNVDRNYSEAIFFQTRQNAAAVFAAKGMIAKPADHPNVIHLRAMKRFFMEIQENGTVPSSALAEGFKEQLRIMGRQRDAGKYTDTFYETLIRRATTPRLDWNAFAVVLFIDGMYDQATCDSLYRIFLEFNVDPSLTKREAMVEVQDFPYIHQRIYNSVLDPADLTFYMMRLGLDITMTISWDEFLIVFFPRAPGAGMKPLGLLSTPLDTPDALLHH